MTDKKFTPEELENSKRIYNPHLKVHQTGIKSLNLYEY